RFSTLVVRVGVRAADVRPELRGPLFERIRQAVAAVPGAARAALSFTTPVSNTGSNTRIVVPGRSLGPRARTGWVNAVSPDWFETYGVRLIEGRDFTAADGRGAAGVAIVNRSFARRFFATEHPIGRVFTGEPKRTDDTDPERHEIVGLVEDS